MGAGRRSLGCVILATCLAAGAHGCGSTLTATAEVTYPARVPVRTFPRIVVASGHLDAEIALADALAAHLSEDARHDVQRVRVSALEPMRAAGNIAAGTVVLVVQVDLRETSRTDWVSRPDTVCGPAGCYQTTRSDLYEMPTCDGRATLTVHDGPTARLLQRESVRAADEGREYEEMRAVVVARLVERSRALLDARTTRYEVDLLTVDVPVVQRALARIDRGDWHGGRRILERAARSDAIRALPDPARARVYYDLAQARRFDPDETDPAARFDRAERALRRAMDLHPEALYVEALRALEAHERAATLLDAQEDAAAHNFALTPGAPAPEPPASYRAPPLP